MDKCKHKPHTNLEAYKEAVKVFPDDCAKDSETVHLLRMGYQVCYERHQMNGEQYKITKQEMIEKACKTYCRFCPHQCENYPHEDCFVQIEFKKTMEKQIWKKKN